MSLSNNAKMNCVALFGVPRSGTSWIGQIINSSPKVIYRYQPLFSYEYKDRLNEASSSSEISQFHNDLIDARSDFVTQAYNVSGNNMPQFRKETPTLLVWKEVRYINIIRNLLVKSNTKCVFILRHPAAVINSWIRAPKEFDVEWNARDEWRFASKKNKGSPQEFYGYEKWKQAVEIFLNLRLEFPERVLVLKYEEVAERPSQAVSELFKFCDIEVGPETHDFLVKTTELIDMESDPYSVYKNTPDINHWKDELDPFIAKLLLDDFSNTALKGRTGY